MTEPNHTTGTDPAGEDAQVTWPALPAVPGDADTAAGDDPSRDPAVSALLRRLGDLPDLPVARHEEVYALLHDELLAALNESIAAPPTKGPAAAGPTTSPGDATNEQA
ncbi:hypothetical protein J2W14_002775 [Pseudarthrobacter oxydans]|uniref:hypothetical protein n=1 Tax=Pseudarthrobacter oxydans TaxID=1671 RepID=UPI00278ACE51|nr:hypothetical protein [Pseudarthrobacter oxydans]MDP9983362.1 hypothetical protein [Pseudarthrobacter oxydans]